jgi:hypothetical protein
MGKMLMGAFERPEQADRALRELEEHGYTPEEISAISSSNQYEGKGYEHTGNEMASSAASGALTGGVIGGLAGLLAGVGVFPALAGLFVGGPIAAALGLAGAAATTAAGAVTGAAAGGLIGALTHMGVPQETAQTYDEMVKNGGVVLGLSGHDEMTDEARDILERNGAQNVHRIDMKETEAAPGSTERVSDEAREHEEAALAGTAPSRGEPAFGETTGAEPMREDMSAEDPADETRPDSPNSAADEYDDTDASPSRHQPSFGETAGAGDMVESSYDDTADTATAVEMREKRQRELREQERQEDI